MKKRSPYDNFRVETLEPRILLSGDPLAGGLCAVAPDLIETSLPAEEILYTSQDSPSQQRQEPYNPGENLPDLFSGMAVEPLAAAADDTVTAEDEIFDGTDRQDDAVEIFPSEDFPGQDGIAVAPPAFGRALRGLGFPAGSFGL